MGVARISEEEIQETGWRVWGLPRTWEAASRPEEPKCRPPPPAVGALGRESAPAQRRVKQGLCTETRPVMCSRSWVEGSPRRILGRDRGD